MTSRSSRYAPPKRDGYECARYMDSVLSGETVTSKKVRRLCETMRPRIEGGYKCWHYDPAKAKRPVEFIERFCCIPAGKANTPLRLEPFQLFVLELTFGFVDEYGNRQFQELFWVMARKNGKTSLMAAVALYMLTKDGEFAPQCYSMATSQAQASLLYGAMLSMVSQSAALSKRVRKGIVAQRHQDGLLFDDNRGYFTTLSSQSRRLDGLDIHFAAIDELAAFTNRDLFDLLKQGTSSGSRNQPLIVEITTNGFERDNLFDDQYAYAAKVLDGKAEDDSFLPVIYELDERKEWTDERMWVKANPGLGPIKDIDSLRSFVNKAKQDPSFLPTVMTKDFNIPENKASAWLTFEEAVNRETFDWRKMGFRYCVVGYDASDTVDLTSGCALMMRAKVDEHGRKAPDTDHIYEMNMYWLPEAQLESHRRSGARTNRDNVPYDKWIEQGLVRTCPGNIIDHRVIFEWMQELRDEYDVYPFALGYDPWHLTDDSWRDAAAQFVGNKRLFQVRFGAKTLSAPMKEIRALYAEKRIIDNDNPVNQWCRMNVGVVADKNDNIQPVKANGPHGRIDGWAAEICAYIALKNLWDDYLGMV